MLRSMLTWVCCRDKLIVLSMQELPLFLWSEEMPWANTALVTSTAMVIGFLVSVQGLVSVWPHYFSNLETPLVQPLVSVRLWSRQSSRPPRYADHQSDAWCWVLDQSLSCRTSLHICICLPAHQQKPQCRRNINSLSQGANLASLHSVIASNLVHIADCTIFKYQDKGAFLYPTVLGISMFDIKLSDISCVR